MIEFFFSKVKTVLLKILDENGGTLVPAAGSGQAAGGGQAGGSGQAGGGGQQQGPQNNQRGRGGYREEGGAIIIQVAGFLNHTTINQPRFRS
jgi:hypothetical protein